MALKPLSLTLVVDHLTAHCPAFHLVAKAANMATVVENHQHVKPAAFVVEPSYQARGTPDASGIVIQPHQYEIGIITVVQNYGDVLGSHQSEDAEELRGQLWAAMLGWTPEAEGFTFDLGRGALLSFDDQVFMYLDTFKLERVVRNRDPY